jgi:small conductance mechanosensitive channel
MVESNLLIERGIDMLVNYFPKILLAIITFFSGIWIINFLIKAIDNSMKKNNVEVSLRRFLKSFMRISFKTVLIISVIAMIGVDVSSFIAVLATAGFAIGMALQGSLSNFAGGILILFFKPFKVDEFIEAQGHIGKVESIQILNTILKTPDNKTVVIPNGILSNGVITNFTREKTRRIEFIFGVSYRDDIKKVKKVLESIVKSDKRILKEPSYLIAVKELGESSVNFVVRVWVNGSDYWNVFFDMQETVKLTFDKNKISIPYPQRDVHMKRL